jgi:hypothetical protein
MDALIEREWQAWQDLTAKLKALGSVTEEDCASPVTECETPGQDLFAAIREWGRLNAKLRNQHR